MMRYIGMSMMMAILVAGVAGAQDKAEVTVKMMPPSVVKTVPQAGDTEVDPSLKEITVTFSKDMMTEKMWSWVIFSPGMFPKITGKVGYLDDKRTCTASVRLEPKDMEPGDSGVSEPLGGGE